MGFSSINPETNGEHLVLKKWTQFVRRRGTEVFVVDVGANEGDFTKAVLDSTDKCKIFAFEPNPPTFDRLSRRFSGESRLKIVNQGLADAEQTLTLYDQSGKGGTGRATMLSGVFDHIYNQQSVGVPVTTTTLDAFAEIMGIDQIDYLKIDAEGFEDKILSGAHRLISENRIGTIQLEFNIHNAISGFSFARLASIFESYRIFRVLPRTLLPIKNVGPYAVQSHNELAKYCNYLIIKNDPSLVQALM